MKYRQISRRAARRTRSQRAEMVERFRQSGLSRSAFAERIEIHLGTLNRWLAEAQGGGLLAAPLVFGELQLRSRGEVAAVSWAMELVGANGLTIRCREALPMEELGRWLRG